MTAAIVAWFYVIVRVVFIGGPIVRGLMKLLGKTSLSESKIYWISVFLMANVMFVGDYFLFSYLFET